MPRTKKTDEAAEESLVEQLKKEVKKERKSKKEEAEKEAAGKAEEEKAEKKKARKAEGKTEEEKKEKVLTEEDRQKAERNANMLVPIEDYVKCGAHLGTRVITPEMKKYVYRRRADGLAVLNTNKIDDKLKEAVKFLNQYEAKDVIIVCKREAGWRAAEMFSKLTGIRAFIKKYPAGILTNLTLPDFFETNLAIVCDPWIDKNAMRDVKRTGKKVMALCDTNNYVTDEDAVIPCNNKSNKSIGLILYTLAKEYVKAKGIDKQVPELEEFVGEKLEAVPIMKEK